MTHKDLVQAAAKWLQKRHPIVITEMASGAMEEPDAIGWKGHFSTLIECKVSRADFFANRSKNSRGMGCRRYFMTPPGLVQISELPDGWGLLEVSGRGISEIREAGYAEERDVQGEVSILVSALRRIGQACPTGVSVKCYTYQTKNRATLGVEIDGR